MGIETSEELRKIGSKQAWLNIKAIDPSACYSRLCALEGAIQEMRWHNLPDEIKADLKNFYNQFKSCLYRNGVRLKMNGQNRNNIKIGSMVNIVLKADQRTGKLTKGTVMKILTNSANHPHGIKVMLEDGQVGRVQEVVNSEV